MPAESQGAILNPGDEGRKPASQSDGTWRRNRRKTSLYPKLKLYKTFPLSATDVVGMSPHPSCTPYRANKGCKGRGIGFSS